MAIDIMGYGSLQGGKIAGGGTAVASKCVAHTNVRLRSGVYESPL